MDRPFPLDPNVTNIADFCNYYEDLEKDDGRTYWITAKNCDYEDLNSTIEPGDYCCYYHKMSDGTLGHNHSMIFIRWTDGFNPMRKVNKMTTISGVSSGIKVIDNYEVGVEERPHKDRDRYIYWNNNYNYREFNGFGPTDKL